MHVFAVFFFHHPLTTELSTLSLHDALPISIRVSFAGRRTGGGTAELDRLQERRRDREAAPPGGGEPQLLRARERRRVERDRKSTRLNSSHITISYAVFCLKKKKKTSSRYAT